MIQYLEEQQSSEGLVKALSHPNMGIRLKALQSLQNFTDKQIIPQLIDILEEEKYPAEGSEEATIHQTFKTSLCDAISKLSGRHYTIENINDERDVMTTVGKMREWCKANLKT